MKKRFVLFPLYLVALAFPLFLHLETRTVRLWDEALFALRALYWNETGKILQDFSHFDQLPYHLNTKPVFTSFFQVLSFKIFGYNELGLRFPMAMFSLLCIAVMIWASKKIFDRISIGMLAGLMMVTSQGYLIVHVGRGGEQDAALACLMFISTLGFYFYLENIDSKSRNKYLLLCTFALVAAVLTKLIVGLFFIPGYLVFLIYKKKLKNVLTDKWFYVFFILAIAIILSYYLIMDHYNSGYLKRLWEYELVGRYTSVIETDSLAWNYYIQRIVEGKFQPWFVFVLLSLLWIRKSWTRAYKDFIVLGLFSVAFYLLIISVSQTKKFWYDAPVYPILSMIAAIGLYQFYTYLHQSGKLKQMSTRIIFGILGMALFAIPYTLIIQKIYWPKNEFKADKYGYLFRKLERNNPDIKKFDVAIADFGASAAFYQQAYNIEKGYEIDLKRSADYEIGDFVMTCLDNALNPIKEKYELEQYQYYDECRLWRISGIKEGLPEQ